MKHIAWVYLVSLVIFLLLDTVWLIKISPSIYQHYIGDLMTDKPRLLPALFFYLIYIAALVAFVVQPALDRHSITYALKMAPLLGLASYATFDLTNRAVLANWPLAISLIDLSWGVFITTASSAVIVWILR